MIVTTLLEPVKTRRAGAKGALLISHGGDELIAPRLEAYASFYFHPTRGQFRIVGPHCKCGFEETVSDPLYLSLWFSDFSGPEMLPHAFTVMQQFPFSEQRPGITYFALHPVSWNEATVLERRFPGGIDAGQAALIAAELVHDDYAYVFEAHWDLWMPDQSNANWVLEPATVKFIVQGEEFDEGAYQQTGHMEIDFGPDSYFLQPETSLSEQTRAKIRDNVAKLVEFSKNVEKNSGASARLLWSESEESLARKLIARLQGVQ